MDDDRRQPIGFVNNSGEEIPRGAVLEPDGTVDDGGRVGVVKPTRSGSLAVYLNDDQRVPADAVGQGRSPFPWGIARIDPADLPMTTGVALGVVAGQWFLRRSGVGFRAVGPAAYGSVPVIVDGSVAVLDFRITGDDGGSPRLYSGVQAYTPTTAGVFADLPGGLVLTNKLVRIPSNLPSPAAGTEVPPLIPPTQYVCARPDPDQPGYWRIVGARGGMQTVEFFQYQPSCGPSGLVVANNVVRITGPDLTATVITASPPPSPPPPARTPTLTATTSLDFTHALVIVPLDTSGGAFTVTLPSAANMKNFWFKLLKIGAGTSPTLAVQSGEYLNGTLDGITTWTVPETILTCYSDNLDTWYVERS